MLNKDFQDRIDDFILGRMPEEEKTAFLKEIEQDEKKKEQFEFTQKVKAAITSRQEKLAKLKQMKEIYDIEKRAENIAVDQKCYRVSKDQVMDQSANKKSSKRIWMWTSAIVAVFVAGFFLIDPYGRFDEMEPHGTIRGNDEVFEYDAPSVDADRLIDSILNDTITEDSISENNFTKQYE